jgi:glycogen operon protein
VFRRRRYFQGRPIRGEGVKDIYWLQPDGSEMDDEAWSDDDQAVGVYIAGAAADLLDERGDPTRDDNMLLLFNSRDEDIEFRLPMQGRRRSGWRIELDTARLGERRHAVQGVTYLLERRSVAVLSHAN